MAAATTHQWVGIFIWWRSCSPPGAWDFLLFYPYRLASLLPLLEHLREVCSLKKLKRLLLWRREELGGGLHDVLLTVSYHLCPFIHRPEQVGIIHGVCGNFGFDGVLQPVALFLGQGIVSHVGLDGAD